MVVYQFSFATKLAFINFWDIFNYFPLNKKKLTNVLMYYIILVK